MALQFETNEKLDFSDPPVPGKYHFQIVDVDETGDQGELTLSLEVLAGTVAKMEGRIKKYKLYPNTNMVKHFHKLAITLGLSTQEQYEKMHATGQTASYDFVSTKGRHVMGEIVVDSYEKDGVTKTNERIQPWDLYAVDDPKVASWPKNVKMLKEAGYNVGDAPTKPTETPAEKPADGGLLDGVF